MRLLVVSVDVACSVYHQRHWVNWGCVSLKHWNMLCIHSIRVHTSLAATCLWWSEIECFFATTPSFTNSVANSWRESFLLFQTLQKWEGFFFSHLDDISTEISYIHSLREKSKRPYFCSLYAWILPLIWSPTSAVPSVLCKAGLLLVYNSVLSQPCNCHKIFGEQDCTFFCT